GSARGRRRDRRSNARGGASRPVVTETPGREESRPGVSVLQYPVDQTVVVPRGNDAGSNQSRGDCSWHISGRERIHSAVDPGNSIISRPSPNQTNVRPAVSRNTNRSVNWRWQAIGCTYSCE